MVNYRELAELEYAKLLSNEDVSAELLENEEFYNKFVSYYDAIGHSLCGIDGRNKIDVVVENGSVTITAYDQDPKNTRPLTGYFYPLESMSKVTFRIEEMQGKKYLRVADDQSTLYPGSVKDELGHSIPSDNEDVELVNHSNVELYEGNVLVGSVLYKDTSKYRPDLGKKASVNFEKPYMPADCILKGMIPSDIESLSLGDYSYIVSYRTILDNGLVEKVSSSRTDGVLDSKYSIAAINLDCLNTIWEAKDFVVYDSNMNIIDLNPQFKTPDEAKNFFTQRYQDSLGNDKTM